LLPRAALMDIVVHVVAAVAAVAFFGFMVYCLSALVWMDRGRVDAEYQAIAEAERARQIARFEQERKN
jgi:hypothetical protein